MKNCEKINLLKSTIQKTAIGTITTLIAESEISVKKSISFDEKTLLANNIYYKIGNPVNQEFTTIDLFINEYVEYLITNGF